MSISIAIATYNGANYLQKQLDSFVAPRRLPNKLIVCDYGSTDGVINIAKAFRENAPFDVRIYRNEATVGYIKNFGNTISLCSGDIIFLSDEDDVWFRNKLAVMADVLMSQPGTRDGLRTRSPVPL